MEIKPSEVESVEQIGTLDGSPVRLLKTIGGFWICLGKLKNKTQEEALAAGSHPAIVKYNIEKQFSNFQPKLAKSESTEKAEEVVGFTELLPQSMQKNGYEMFSLSKENNIKYILTKYGVHSHCFEAKITKESLKITKAEKPLAENLRGFSKAVSLIAAQKAEELKKSYLEYENFKFQIKKNLENGT